MDTQTTDIMMSVCPLVCVPKIRKVGKNICESKHLNLE